MNGLEGTQVRLAQRIGQIVRYGNRIICRERQRWVCRGLDRAIEALALSKDIVEVRIIIAGDEVVEHGDR